MSSYRAIIAGTTVLVVFMAVGFGLLSDQVATVGLALVLLAEGFGDVLATLYIFRLVLHDVRRPRSWLLLFLLTAAGLITLGLLPIDVLVVRSFLGFPPLAGGLGRVITGMGLILIGGVPVMKAALFYLVARRSPVIELLP